jgi:hypothetical protein
MALNFALGFWLGLFGYTSLGLLVGLWLLGFGLARFDNKAAQAPWWVKLLWLPGMLALWPVLLRRALGARAQEDCNIPSNSTKEQG